VVGKPHARGISWLFRVGVDQPRRSPCLQAGGGQKVQSCTWCWTTSPLIGRFFPLASISGRPARRLAGERAERGQPIGWGLRPPKRCAIAAPRPRQTDPGAIAGRVCCHAPGPHFGRNTFAFSGRLSGSYALLGNNGNMGTSYVRQAERRASKANEPVPKPFDCLGNMGTEMADPNAGKSARVWRPPAPSSR